MAKVALNKSSLTKQRDNLRLYERLLPSLELKRQQLMAEFARAREELSKCKSALAQFQSQVGEQIPMLANREIDLTGLVRLDSVEIGEENVVGVKLPTLEKLNTSIATYAFLGRPHWVDLVAERLHQTTELLLQTQVAGERVKRMDQAVRRITQRVNLFEKIMIPTARKNIKRIQIFLGDAERSAVVRSKIAKKKRLQARQEAVSEGTA
jgi:V/A-type H+-transporting ATPase subunit D